jgi:hypothetical protein
MIISWGFNSAETRVIKTHSILQHLRTGIFPKGDKIITNHKGLARLSTNLARPVS